MKQQHLRLPVRFTAALLAAVLGCTCLTACSGQKEGDSAASTDTSVTDSVNTESKAETESTAETEPPTTEHISPVETVVSTLGSQIDVDAILNRDNDNTYKASLTDLIQPGDVVSSFTFVFYAGDGVSNIGTYEGGCGISVTADCTAATDEGWYQSDNFTQQANGSYIEVTWNVPPEIQPYIEANGEVLVGYWWGNTTTVRLTSIICSYTRTAQLPVDGTQTISVGQTLNFNDDARKSVNVSLADVLADGQVPQAVTFDISAGGSFGKFTGAFGITANDWTQTGTIAVLTDASNLQLTWIIPDDIKPYIPSNADVMLGYWWSETGDITLNSITVKYSCGSGGTTAEPGSPSGSTDSKQEESDKPVVTNGNAAAIAADIRVGWNLGNTLDCYNVDWAVANHESAWGNPKTTKEMIDTVKAAGFNAVRIPVSWTDHMDADGNVEAAWMDRVQEVVDYSMDNGLYTILNVHHDDYTWLNPTYADEAAVKTKFVKLWSQIADRFQDYDLNLLFEGMNEPRVVGSPNEWMGGTPEEHDVINHLHQAFVDTVRASGGNNADRTLIVTTHAASITSTAVNGLVVPNDGNIIVSIHSYAPWKFTTLEYPNDKTFDQNGMAELDKGFDVLYSKFVLQGIPVIIGEFGAENKGNDADREAYYAYYVESAALRGIPCFIWDNGPEDSFGLLNRSTCSWYNQKIIDGIMNAVD